MKIKNAKKMKKSKSLFLVISLIILSTAIQAADKSASFAKYTPAPKVIDGIQYPTHPTLYRGTSKKRINLQNAIRGMFGKSDEYMMSTLFKNIRKALMKKRSPESIYAKIHSDAYYVEAGDNKIIAMIDNIRGQQPKGRIYDIKTATKITKDIIDQYWANRTADQDLGNYIDYKSMLAPKIFGYPRPPYSNYRGHGKIDWPSKVLFSTTRPDIASQYGNTVVLFKEKKQRSLDLGFWNYTHNGIWFKSAADAGEFVVPGYISANEIVGYELRERSETVTKRPKDGGFGFRLQHIYNAIGFGFYKSIIAGKTYILVFPGKDQDNGLHHSCIKKVNEITYTFCITDGAHNSRAVKAPRSSYKRAPLLGVVALCEKGKPCQIPRQLYATLKPWRARYEYPLPKKFRKLFKPGKEVIKIDGMVAKYFKF